jgi:integrase
MVTAYDGADQLWLFGEDGGFDLRKLRMQRDSLRGSQRAASTMKSYASDWRSFAGWCSVMGRQSLPADQETVSVYVTWLLEHDKKRVSTAQRHLASIADAHRRASLPVPAMGAARETITGVRRKRREQPNGKVALSVSDLKDAARTCDVSTVRGTRDRAIIVLGFASGLRRAELGRLQCSDVTFEQKGLKLFVRYAKTDQEGRGRTLGVWSGKKKSTDPVRALKAWIAKRGRWDGPLFCRIQTGDVVTRIPMRGQAIAEVVKSAVTRLGLDPTRYAGHSLRSGAVTASADLGRSDQELMRLSGHRSAAQVRAYVRGSDVFAGRNPLAGVL